MTAREAQDLTDDELERLLAERRRRTERAEATDPALLLGWIGDLLGPWVRLVGVERLDLDPPEFVLVFEGGARATISHRALGRQADVRAVVEPAVRRAMRTMSRAEFDEFRDFVLRVAVDVSLGAEATTAGRGRALLDAYLDARTPGEDSVEATTFGTPFTEDGVTYVSGPALRKWASLTEGERIDHREMGRMLKAAGCEAVTVDRRHRGGRARSYWRLP